MHKVESKTYQEIGCYSITCGTRLISYAVNICNTNTTKHACGEYWISWQNITVTPYMGVTTPNGTEASLEVVFMRCSWWSSCSVGWAKARDTQVTCNACMAVSSLCMCGVAQNDSQLFSLSEIFLSSSFYTQMQSRQMWLLPTVYSCRWDILADRGTAHSIIVVTISSVRSAHLSSRYQISPPRPFRQRLALQKEEEG